MKALKNLPLIIAVAGVWLLIVTVWFLTVVKVDHYDLLGWVFTIVLIEAITITCGFVVVFQKIDELEKEQRGN